MEIKYGNVKAIICANGSVHKAWMKKEGTSSLTAYLESIMLTSMIEAKEYRAVAAKYIPNSFIQTPINSKPGIDKIMIKIKVLLVNILVPMDPGNMFPTYSMKKERKCYILRFLKISIVF